MKIENIDGKVVCNTDIYDKYMLLEIKLNDKYIIHTDPYYGFYTKDNISQDKIKILKENL